MDIYEEARKRIETKAQAFQDFNMTKKEHEKRLNRLRVKKYSLTPKGRESNARRCKRYQKKHQDKILNYVMKWQDDFFQRHGVKYGTYRARVRRGIPEEMALSTKRMKAVKE